MVTRTRRQHNKEDPAKYLYKHSPLKNGLKVKDEYKPLEHYSKILPKIYLGNYKAAKDKDFFKKKNIKAVLNCTHDIPHHFRNSGDIEYMRIPVEDSLKEYDIKRLYSFAPVIVAFIDKHVNLHKNNIFIHCQVGRERSATAVVLYLMEKHKLTPTQACKLVMDKRKEAFFYGTSLNFEDTIMKYYKKLQKEKC